jgi:hypothetical protein
LEILEKERKEGHKASMWFLTFCHNERGEGSN